ncbi:hypothetical protein DFH29DRAFT_1002340 [Suillus ampliporus]|nr:hypothetical protein DFH29DRAFT_1002340 [Suillus ampliporus]
MTQKIPENPSAVDRRPSPSLSYMDSSPVSFDYIEEQFGGGRRYELPPAELTPSWLRTRLKATERDIGIVKDASAQCQAYQNPSAEAQLPIGPFHHVVQDGASTSTSETSLLTLNVVNSRHASPFPPPAPAPLQDLFYSPMDQQPPWMEQNPSDDFGMMQPHPFTGAGLLGDQALGMVGVGEKSPWPAPSVTNVQGSQPINVQNATHLAPLLSHMPFHFPASSSAQSGMSQGCSLDPAGQRSLGFTQNSSFTLHPVPSLPSQDDAPPIPATNIILPTPLKDGGSNTSATSASADNGPPRDPSPKLDTGYYPPAATHRVRFPEESELITHQEDQAVTGCRSADMNAALDTGFADIERYFLELSASTTLPMNQLINLYLKSRGRSVSGTNYWNLYVNYFKDHIQEELSRIGKEVPEGSGTPSATLRTRCYEKFKDTFPDAYQDILSKHEEVSLLGSSAQTIAQRGQVFQKYYRSVISILQSCSARFGFEAAIVLCGKVVNEDGSLGHSYSTPGAAGFWEMRCRASDDVIIGHLKAHVYNTTSLSAVEEAFPETEDDSRKKLTPSLANDVDQPSNVVEGRREDGLKFMKQEITKQAAKFHCTINSGKIFPWKLMPAVLVEANLRIEGYPAHKCILPGEAHSKNALNKGIGALMQKEIATLIDSLKAGTMRITQFPKEDRSAVTASEKAVIEGEAPPPEWPHHGARRLFLDGHTDHNGLPRLKPSTATTKVKKGKAPESPMLPSDDEPSTATTKVKKGKAPKSPPPPSDDEGVDNDDAVGTSAPKPLPRMIVRKPNPNMRVEVVPPPSRPFKVVRPPPPPSRPFRVVPKPPATQSEVIEVTSTEEDPVDESDPEYEEPGHGKKRKLKSANTSRALKKIAPSTEKTNAPKVGKKGGRGKNNAQSKAPPPPLPTSNTFPVKGGPLSPLTVGSSTNGPSSPEHSKASKAMRLRDGLSDESKKERVKPRPVTKDSWVVMNHGLRTVYETSSSESDVNKSMKADSATTMGTIPEATGSANIQSDLSEEKYTQLVKDEVVGGMEEELPPTAPLNVVAPAIPNQQPLRDSNTARPHTPHETQDKRPHDAPCDNPRDGHDPPRDPLHDPRDGRDPLRDPPRDPLHHEDTRSAVRNPAHNYHEVMRDPRDGLRDAWDADPRYPYTRGYSRYSQESARGLDHGALHPRDAFYHRNSRNPRYGPPQDPYGSGDIRAESDLNTRDSSPASDFHDNYGPGEHERTYPTRYSPGVDSGYAREGGYRPRCDDIDERRQSLSPYHSRPVGGENYREGGYPQGPSRRFQDSRWDEGAHFDYGRDAIPRAFNRDLPNPPRPPPAT